MTIAGMYASLQELLITSAEYVLICVENALALAILVGAVTLLTRRWIAPRFRYLMWLLVALRLAIPIAPASPFSLQQLWLRGDASREARAATVSDQWAVQVAAHADPLPAGQFNVIGNEPAGSITATDYFAHTEEILILVWASGGVLCALILCIQTLRFRRKLGQQAVSGNPRRRQLLEECRQLAGVRRHVRLREVTGLHSPAQMGLFRPTVLLPVDLAQTFSEEQLRHIFLHELAHVKRSDVAVNGLLALLRILHWWNPLYWLVQSRLFAEREQACDVQVLKCLGAAEGRAYGETLLGVVARLTASAERRLTLPTSALGLVTFLGRKSSLRRRLRSLKHAGRRELRVQRVAGATLTLVLLVVGGTDRPGSDAVAEDRAFQLPAETTWSLAPAFALEGEERITRVYAVGDLVKLFTQEMNVSPADAMKTIQTPVELMGILPVTPAPPDRTESQNRTFYNWYEKDGEFSEMLIVATSRTQHETLGRLLSVWRTHGPGQISLEVRLITAPADQPQPVGGGGRIVSPGPGLLSRQSNISLGSDGLPVNPAAGARGRIVSERRVPVYIQTLGRGPCDQIINAAQAGERTNVMCAPKVTLFNGQQATVTSAVQRPFVTGLDDSSGSIQPQIEVIQDGLSLELLAVSDANTGRIRLDCNLSLDTIVNVSETSVSRGEGVEPLTIQVPEVESQQYAASGEVADGESLLISPLNVDDTGRRLYAIITPRRVAPDVWMRDED